MKEKKLFAYEEIKQKMVNYCVYQDRCHAEVENKMKEYVLIPEAKEEIILYLIKENYLNEERFTRSYIRGKFYIKKWGRNKIKINLLQKKVNEKLISKSFEEIDENDYLKTIDNYIQKITESNKFLNVFQLKNKILKYLLSKGFEYEIVLLQMDKKNSF